MHFVPDAPAVVEKEMYSCTICRLHVYGCIDAWMDGGTDVCIQYFMHLNISMHTHAVMHTNSIRIFFHLYNLVSVRIERMLACPYDTW